MQFTHISRNIIGGAVLLCCPLFVNVSLAATPLIETKSDRLHPSPAILEEIVDSGNNRYALDSLPPPPSPLKRLQPSQAECFQVKHLYAPALLLGLGLWGTIENSWLHRQDKLLNHSLNGHSNWQKNRIDDMLQYLPMVSYQGLALFPQIRRSHTFRERLLLHATATAIMASIVNISKHTIEKPRPDLAANNSFPSGHTATAFLGAELTRLEYGGAYGWASYGLATSVAGMRMYNKRHWLSDVLAGAGVGILSARIAHWILPWQRRLLGWKEAGSKKNSNVIVVPNYDVAQRAPQLHISLSF